MTEIAQPDKRGWGAWPGPAGSTAAKRFTAANIVSIHPLGPHPKPVLQVNKDLAAVFSHFLVHMSEIYHFNQQVDDWGLSIRANKNNPDSPSWHSWGIAIDLDASQNPNGSHHTTFPVDETRKWAHAFGLRWGYDYHSTKDPMHFEFCGTRKQAQYWTWYMAQSPGVQKTKPHPYTYSG